jgi:hypothetical protein
MIDVGTTIADRNPHRPERKLLSASGSSRIFLLLTTVDRKVRGFRSGFVAVVTLFDTKGRLSGSAASVDYGGRDRLKPVSNAHTWLIPFRPNHRSSGRSAISELVFSSLACGSCRSLSHLPLVAGYAYRLSRWRLLVGPAVFRRDPVRARSIDLVMWHSAD